MTAAEQWAWVARIRRTQGRKGEVFAEILTDFPEKFAERRRLWLLPGSAQNKGAPPGRSSAAAAGQEAVPREVELTAYWLHKGGIVLHFAGIDSISAAEALSGMVVAIPRAERAPLGEDEAYIGDLIGCTLVDVAKEVPVVVGEIEDVDTTAGPAPLLVVRGRTAGQQVSKSASQQDDGNEVLIPFARSYLRRLDLDARRVEMALPEGLVELNAPE
jgi:16S rRNA processing protein RimM